MVLGFEYQVVPLYEVYANHKKKGYKTFFPEQP